MIWFLILYVVPALISLYGVYELTRETSAEVDLIYGDDMDYFGFKLAMVITSLIPLLNSVTAYLLFDETRLYAFLFRDGSD